MKKLVLSVLALLITVALIGCASAPVAPTTAPLPTSTVPSPTFTPSSIPPTPTAKPQSSNTSKLNLDWLLTADEINSISEDIGVVQWELVDVSPGENRICHSFNGQSWSANPNEALNCVFKIAPGSSFEDIVSSMLNSGQLFPDEKPLSTSLILEGDFGVFGGTYPNGHGVYDLLLVKNNLLYWVSVTLGRPVGKTTEDLYKENQKVIDTFLNDSITTNLEKSK